MQKEKKALEIVTFVTTNEFKIFKILKTKKLQKVLAIEWIEPFFTAGHWVPEMIELAGGINLISKTGEHSRRMNID